MIICVVALLIVARPGLPRHCTCVFVNFIFASADTFPAAHRKRKDGFRHFYQKLIMRITLSVAPALLVT